MFKEIKIEEMKFNPFTTIGKEWILITAGTKEKFNTMTASWGVFRIPVGEKRCGNIRKAYKVHLSIHRKTRNLYPNLF